MEEGYWILWTIMESVREEAYWILWRMEIVFFVRGIKRGREERNLILWRDIEER